MNDRNDVTLRLQRLERYNRYLTLSVVISLIMIFSMVILEKTPASYADNFTINPAGGRDIISRLSGDRVEHIIKKIHGEKIVASSFEVVDPVSKKVVARLSRNPQTNLPKLAMFDTQGKPRVELALTPPGESGVTDPNVELTMGNQVNSKISIKVASNHNPSISLSNNMATSGVQNLNLNSREILIVEDNGRRMNNKKERMNLNSREMRIVKYNGRKVAGTATLSVKPKNGPELKLTN